MLTKPMTAEELIGLARACKQLLGERAAEVEAAKRVPADLMARLVGLGLTRAGLPRSIGGYQFPPSVLARIGYELGQGCGSTAWATTVSAANAWFASYWSEEAQADIGSSEAEPVLAGALLPTGSAERCEGGYNVRGAWPFASNVDNSNWVIVSCAVPLSPGAAPTTCWFLVPIEQLEIDPHSWNVVGMQGTGSKTVRAPQTVFVPEHRAIRFPDIAALKAPGQSLPGNTTARILFPTFGSAVLVGPILGMAQGAVDLYVELMRRKLRTSMQAGVTMGAANSPFVQSAIGRAQALLDTATTNLFRELEDAESRIFAGAVLDTAERLKVRRALVLGARAALDAVNLVVEMAGASSSDSGLPLQRFWRDINAATKHASLDVNAVMTLMGQHALGIEPKGAF